MKVLVIGATGRTGVHVVKKLLTLGHEVTAFARQPEALTDRHKHLTLVPGDVRDLDAVSSAVKNVDTAIVVLAPRVLGKSDLYTYRRYRDWMQTIAIRNLVYAMKASRGQRLVNISSWGLEPRKLGFLARRIFIPFFSGNVLEDKRRAEAELVSSYLDYVNVRPGRLISGNSQGDVRASADGTGLKSTITHEDLAKFLVSQLTDDAWLRKTVYVGY